MSESVRPIDPRLVEDAKRGNLQAFEGIIRHYQDHIFRFLFHFTGHPSEAEDVAQETFLMVHRKLHLHQSGQPFTGWLFTIARNLAVSHHRKRAPAPYDPEVVAGAIRDVSDSPEEALLMKEAADEVHLSLQRLPEEFREVLILRYLLDLPLQDVAQLLEIPEGTAKSRVFKARNQLRDIMVKNVGNQETFCKTTTVTSSSRGPGTIREKNHS